MRDYVNSTALQEYTTKLVAKLKTLFPGTPTAAATVADMTDHSKTYVYVGSETGYTAGDWYYWNGTAWTSGGPFQATSIITDTTLAVAGEAADAKATGDAIAAAKTAVLNAMAPAYSTSGTYKVGNYVNQNGAIYRCTTAITTAEAWTAGHWTEVPLGTDLADQVGELKTQIKDLEDTQIITLFSDTVSGTRTKTVQISIPSGTYHLHVDSVDSTAATGTTSNMIFFNGSSQVKAQSINRQNGFDNNITLNNNVTSIVFYGLNNYSDSAGIEFSFNNVSISKNTVLNERITALENSAVTVDDTLAVSGDAADAKIVGDKIVEINQAITAIANNLAPDYDNTLTYRSGDYVVYENVLYKCTTTISTAEAWRVDHWKSIAAMKELFTAMYALGNYGEIYNGIILPLKTEIVYVFAKKDDVIVINLSGTSGVRISVRYSDGTVKASIQAYNNDFIFRAEKDIESISIYNGSANNNVSVIVTKSYEPLHITNYYDKSAKISGYINNGNVESGYYHSDFIPFVIGDTIIANGYPSTFGTTVRFHLYDKNKEYLGRVSASLREDGLYQRALTLDSIGSVISYTNVRYVNFNMTTAGSDTAVCYITNVPDTNLDYGQYQPDTHDFFNAQQKDYIGRSGNSPVNGKKIAYNGDSIAESRITAGNTYNGGAYPKIIADLTGGTYENRAHGGGILASAPGDGGSTPSRCIVTDVTNMATDADLVCFEGGINDYWRDVPLGSYSESDYTTAVDTTTVCGALESIFRQAKERWVGKPIVFVIVHKIKSTVYLPNQASTPYTFAEEYEKMVGICRKYAIPYYDAYAESGLNAYDTIQNNTFLTSNSSGTADGCHPTEEGYKKYYVPQLIELFNRVMPRN